ncbi:hypothetical protein ASPVEDRAFT_789826 [Aspergillus versicolor CBS 583.65]|uniref:C2H2-type domain-containing protein n=1 Tax=Aspergillus versicolor CBS 583.65 TaxID=1036611 RepID=A0A1L9PSH6_ASPVE|nr:uncharacterized protein ASPVEDRAFT_789826 [Aspergillus versicolor CBS 583.65]OJJ04488.1 hypothetical protein ASPVEDRAFT_789826 [Aspergillus versicolor CBS 583.65]
MDSGQNDDPPVIDPALLDLSRSSSGNFGIDPQLLDSRNHDAGTGVEPVSHRPNYPPNESGRGLPRRRSRYLTRNSAAGPVVVPNASSLDPMERWRNSPPEEEPALIPDIIDALKTTPEPEKHGSGNAFRDYRRAASTTSGESSASSRDSQQSGRSGSSGRRFRAGKNTRKKQSTNALRRYCCTFCCDRFKSKYDWARHEKSLHVTLEAWYCAPFGTTIPSNTPGETLCAFCGITNPTQAHLDTHEPTACASSPEPRRSFRRKDHLVQHLRHAHKLPTASTPPDLESWKIGHSSIPSRCGFCNKSLSTWDERTEHLAEHFRHGQTMAAWTGEHDFPPSFAALVANALPPYLIASESHSCIPFSATNCDVQDHFAQISSRAVVSADDQAEASTIAAPQASSVDLPLPLPLRTIAPGVAPEQLSSFTQVLTLHLSRFAREQVHSGVVPSDEMFQREARRVLYDSEDSWNQTIADNPEWMTAFRELHCDGST